MTTPLILDIIILVILLCFVVGGIRVGFVRALCSFLAVFVAFFGAAMLARYVTPPLSNFLAPYALPAIVEKLEGGAKSKPDIEKNAPEMEESAFSLPGAILPESWTRMIESQDPSAQNVRQPFTSPTQTMAAAVLNIIVFGLIFLLSFVILLVLWRVFSRSLDLVARLPVLNFCNRSLGALLGLIKGLLLLLILRWVLCDLTGLLPLALVENTMVFQWISQLLTLSPLNRLLL